jgi:hypothetical protein
MDPAAGCRGFSANGHSPTNPASTPPLRKSALSHTAPATTKPILVPLWPIALVFVNFGRGRVDSNDPTLKCQEQLHYSLVIMASMEIDGRGNRKAYAVRRWLKAIDRLLKARSMSEKEHAIRWSQAWSTAYLGRMARESTWHMVSEPALHGPCAIN